MAQNSLRTKVFISYSHADRRFLDRLHVFLKPLEREHFIDWWDDTRIKPGDDWQKAIKDALDTTQVALLMLSPDFLASDFIDQDELPPLVEAAAKDHAVILQVVLGPINFGTWKLNNFQAINNPARPLGKLRTRADRDEVWREVSNRIAEALKSGQTATMPAERVVIEKTAETIALIQRQSPTSPALESEENRQSQSPLSSTGLPPSDASDVLKKDRTPFATEIPPPIPLVEAEFQAATKAPPQHQTLSTIQIAWWRLIEVWDEFKSCRLSLIALIAASFFFIFIEQGTEVLRTVGEGMAGGQQWYWPRVFGFFAALILWAICNWYTARVLFYFDFPGVRRRLPSTGSWDNLIDTLETQLPRLLGVGPFLVVGWGFVVASRSYDPAAYARPWLLAYAGLCVLLAIAFYFVLVLRRRLIGKMPSRELESFRELGPRPNARSEPDWGSDLPDFTVTFRRVHSQSSSCSAQSRSRNDCFFRDVVLGHHRQRPHLS